jgi:DNA-binding protein HU-beta
MTKQELVSQIATEATITKKAAEAALNAFTGAISSSLKNGESVSLIGFGTFNVSDRAARTGRNPRTNEPIQIPARKVPTFKAGKALKESVQS